MRSLTAVVVGTATGRAFLADGKPVGWLPALRATQAIYRFRRSR